MGSAFTYRDQELFCEGVGLREIARRFATPCYVYSYARIVENYRAFPEALASVSHLICYAVKANSNGAILRILAREGSGADVVSGGELSRALGAGIPPERIVFAGVGKAEQELAYAIDAGIRMVNVESLEELETIRRIADKMKKSVGIGIRVNPAVEAETHPYVVTGGAKNKFGLPVPQALAAYRRAKSYAHMNVVGIHMHIGSQITDLASYGEALRVLLALKNTLFDEGISLELVDIGGGIGISYSGDPVPSFADLANVVLPMIAGFTGTLTVEPGRSIVGDAGVLLTQVLYRKSGSPRAFVIVDAGMNDLLRPSLYGARHRVVPVTNLDRNPERVEVVGPVCESGDFLAHACPLPLVDQGEYLAVKDVGAYGFSMSSRYNSRPRPAEVLVRGEEAFLIRERESLDDLTLRERIPRFLS